MAYRIQPNHEAFAPTRRKRPRIKDALHLNRIRQLSCIVCGRRPVEAAHIRARSLRWGKRETGIAEKSSDRWTLPLCPEHHREQHDMNEGAFYAHYYISNPFAVALALWAADGDIETMTAIVLHARQP